MVRKMKARCTRLRGLNLSITNIPESTHPRKQHINGHAIQIEIMAIALSCLINNGTESKAPACRKP